jgi:vancomycin resistance protein YoaR
MKKWMIIAGLLALPFSTSAAPKTITYQYEHLRYTISPENEVGWRVLEEAWYDENEQVQIVPQQLRVDGDTVPAFPENWVQAKRYIWDQEAIKATLQEEILGDFNREASDVIINRNDGVITFEGEGMLGRHSDINVLYDLTMSAIEQDIDWIFMPVTETQPTITVNDKKLQDLGIKEIVTVGESNFAGSPANRKHNIATGLDKFNGHLIQPGETFSFNAILGPVNGATGYKKELVIKGERTEPDYGGGLCQISTTAYRGVWEHGFPIVDRRNHSYSVGYYEPVGTDATIWIGSQDVRFENDTQNALLIQTQFTEDGKAYYVYYGTKDTRTTDLIGPFVWDKSGPLQSKTIYTSALPAGASRTVSSPVAGLKAAWFRIINKENGEEIVEPYYSTYTPRGTIIERGGSNPNYSAPAPVIDNTVEPDWL